MENNDEPEVGSDELEAWRAHPITQRALKQTREIALPRALANLEQLAYESSDPKVRAAWQQIYTTRQFIELLEGTEK